MDVPVETKQRIVAVANALYEEVGGSEFPTVAAVRARAGADMNATSVVMKEWRRSHASQAAPVSVDVPEKLRSAHSASLAALWAEAQALANESLQSAQAAWDTERGEAETLRAQLSEAFDAGRRELEIAQAQIASQADQLAKHQAEIQALREDLAKAVERANTSEARASEIDRRASDLAAEVASSHAQAEILHAELAKAAERSGTAEARAAEGERRAADVATQLASERAQGDALRSGMASARAELETTKAQEQKHLAEIQQLRGELLKATDRATATDARAIEMERRLNEVTTQIASLQKETKAELDQARKEASVAREEAARLQGKVEAMSDQHADLLRAFGASSGPGKGKGG